MSSIEGEVSALAGARSTSRQPHSISSQPSTATPAASVWRGDRETVIRGSRDCS
jgi:hypothetical protein